MLAGVQAAALLIAAKRSDAISSEIALHAEKNTDDIKTLIAENTALTSEVKKNTNLLDEIHLHVANIGKKVGAEMAGSLRAPRHRHNRQEARCRDGRFAPGAPPPT